VVHGSTAHYAGHILARERPEATAIIAKREGEPMRRMSWAALGGQVRILATQLREWAFGPVIASWRCCPIHLRPRSRPWPPQHWRVWSCCGRRLRHQGRVGALSGKLAPKVFFYVDAYQYGGKHYDRGAELRDILKGLDTVEHAIHVPYAAAGEQATPPVVCGPGTS